MKSISDLYMDIENETQQFKKQEISLDTARELTRRRALQAKMAQLALQAYRLSLQQPRSNGKLLNGLLDDKAA